MRVQLKLVAAVNSQTILASPRERVATPRIPLRTPRVSRQAAKAIQTPVPLSTLQFLPNSSEVQDLDSNEAVVVELRSQLEEIWHEYASARKRNLALVEEVERLQSHVKRLEAEVNQEQYFRKESDAKLQAAQEAVERCEV